MKLELNLAPGESRGYWKYHTPGKWFKQAKDVGEINNEKATMLFNSGAEISIIDTKFARKAGCVIDESRTQECVKVGENAYMTVVRTKFKVTLDGSLVFNFDVLVGDQAGQEAIQGMGYMVLEGIGLNLIDRTLRLPDKVQIGLEGLRPLNISNVLAINLNNRHLSIPSGNFTEVKIAINPTN